MLEADSLARQHTELAIQTLADILGDPFAEDKDRIKAADSILDRGHGKPAQAIIQVPLSQQQRARLASMSDDELLAKIQGAPLPRLIPLALAHNPEPEPIDAAFTTLDPPLDPLLG